MVNVLTLFKRAIGVDILALYISFTLIPDTAKPVYENIIRREINSKALNLCTSNEIQKQKRLMNPNPEWS